MKTPPSIDEFEISIFGPGIGESVLLHVGDNEWIIVDSCMYRITQSAIALQYLKNLNVDVATAVKLFIVTHWHDDHIRGASTVLKECKNARFVCSGALCSREFLELCFLGGHALMESSGIDEFNQILKIILSQREGNRLKSVGPDQWAIAGRKLNFSKQGGTLNAEICSLSPSDAAMTLAFREIGQMIPKEKTVQRRAISQKPNHVSVALWLIVERLNVLLGSDLENHQDNNLGWRAILLSQNRPENRALIIKVPHHGSSTSYCKEMWDEMIEPDPIALLTPFASGVNPLPSKRDIKNLKNHTEKIFCTGEPSGWQPPRRDAAVERTLREMVRIRRLIHGRMGHIRVRFKVKEQNANPEIRLFNGACLLV